MWVPTAKQLVVVGHDTAFSTDAPYQGARFEVDMIAQALPFQCWISGPVCELEL
jgi:hypothetical protein